MKDVIQLASELLERSRYEAIAGAVVDLTNDSIEKFQLIKENQKSYLTDKKIYFDLASITKPLTMGFSYFLKPEHVSKEMILLMEHRGGLPAWGLLSNDDWKSHLLKFPITESATLYSDYSALRFLLEFEKKEKLWPILKNFYDPEIKFWTELSESDFCLKNGYRNGKEVRGVVHDPNAFTIREFCTHAGLFATLDGFIKTLLKAEKKFHLTEMITAEFEKRKYATRFAYAFDRVEDPLSSLVGPHSTTKTIGHFGFTGTSFWIHPEKRKMAILLSNATCEYWYDKTYLNILRKKIGEYAWT